MRFIVHVWTLNPKVTPWIVEWTDESGKSRKEVTKYVEMDVITWTRSEGHTPCANWYITGDASDIRVEDGYVVIS